MYNADSGLLNAVIDSLHKVFSPATYNCALCALTYSAVRMKKEWKSFIGDLPVSAEFLHRDELKIKYPQSDIALPSVLTDDGNSIQVLVGAEEMNQLKSLEQLMALVTRRAGL